MTSVVAHILFDKRSVLRKQYSDTNRNIRFVFAADMDSKV